MYYRYSLSNYIIAQKSAVLGYFTVETWNHARFHKFSKKIKNIRKLKKTL
jgi:hypothetical protein